MGRRSVLLAGGAGYGRGNPLAHLLPHSFLLHFSLFLQSHSMRLLVSSLMKTNPKQATQQKKKVFFLWLLLVRGRWAPPHNPPIKQFKSRQSNSFLVQLMVYWLRWLSFRLSLFGLACLFFCGALGGARPINPQKKTNPNSNNSTPFKPQAIHPSTFLFLRRKRKLIGFELIGWCSPLVFSFG